MKNNLSSKAIGLDISDHSIEAVLAESSGLGISVLEKHRLVLSPGVLSKGRILDSRALRENLDQLFKRFVRLDLKSDRIVFGFPEADVCLKVFYADRAEDIPQRIIEESAASIPLEKDTSVVVSKAYFNTRKNLYRVLLAAVNKEVYWQWENFFKKFLRRPVFSYDIESLANFRGLFDAYPLQETALLDIGANAGHLAIFNSSGLAFSYSIPYAGDYFSGKIAKALKVGYGQAEKLKKENGLIASSSNVNVSALLRSALSHYVIELSRNFGYYRDNFSREQEEVKKLYLLGGGAQMPGIKDFFQEKLGLPVIIPYSDRKNLFVEAEGLAKKALIGEWLKNDPDFKQVIDQNVWSAKDLNLKKGQGLTGENKRLLALLAAIPCVLALFYFLVL